MEAIIVHSHVNVYNELREDGLIMDVPTTSVDPENNLSAANEMALSLRRLKNENVFFILLSLFQLVLGIDAVSFFFYFFLLLILCLFIAKQWPYLDC